MTVTLETLRADLMAKWEQALNIQIGACDPASSEFTIWTPFREAEPYLEQLSVDAWANGECRVGFGYGKEVVEAAILFTVARDYGLDAAMLYKLSDGAIDPRKDGEK